LYLKNDDYHKEEEKLLQLIKQSNNTKLHGDILEFKEYFIGYVLNRIDDRRVDLLLCNNEGPRRFVVDTLDYKKLKTVNDSISVNNFISSGYERVIEADLDYYEYQIKFSSLFNDYGNNLNIKLKEYWRKKYNNKMTLGEILVLFNEIQLIILENNIRLEKNILGQN
jgi:hypothetical protein